MSHVSECSEEPLLATVMDRVIWRKKGKKSERRKEIKLK